MATPTKPSADGQTTPAFHFGDTTPTTATATFQPFDFGASPTAAAAEVVGGVGAFSLETAFAGFSTGRDTNPIAARTPLSVRLAVEQEAAAAAVAASAAAATASAAASFSFTAAPLPTVAGSGGDIFNPFAKPSSSEFATPIVARPPAAQKKAAKATPVDPVAAVPAAAVAPPAFPPPAVSVDVTRQYAPIQNMEQKILDLVALACRTTFNDPDYDEVLQRIKHHFFHREFEKVFGDPEHLGVYVAQYLPMRALCYAQLWSTHPLLAKLLEKEVVIYCIGAGPGSEAVGITMAREQILRTRVRDGHLTLQQAVAASTPPKFRIHTQDMFDWTPSLTQVLSSLAIHAPIAYRTTNFTFSTSNVTDDQLKTAQFKNSHVMCVQRRSLRMRAT